MKLWNYQTIKLSNYQTMKLWNYETIKLWNYETIKLSNYQTIKLYIIIYLIKYNNIFTLFTLLYLLYLLYFIYFFLFFFFREAVVKCIEQEYGNTSNVTTQQILHSKCHTKYRLASRDFIKEGCYYCFVLLTLYIY